MGMTMKEWFKSSEAVLYMVMVQAFATGLQLLSKVIISEGTFIFALMAYRHVVAAFCVAPFAFFLERGYGKKLSWSVFLWLFLNASTGILLAMGLYYYGMKDTSATYATNFLNLIPIVTFIFSTIFGIEKLGLNTIWGKIKVFGAILCALGALTISLYIGRTVYIGHHSHNHRNIVMNAKHKWTRGSLLLVGSCLSYAIWFIIQVKLFKIFPAKYTATMLTCIIASVESAVVGVCIDRRVDAWKLGWNLQLGTIIYSGVLATAATFCLISWAITHKGPSYPPMFSPLVLIFVTFLEALFLGVALSVGSLLGLCLIIAGSYLFLWGRKHEPKSSLLATNIAAIEVVTVVRESTIEVATVVRESAEFQSPATVRPADSSPIDRLGLGHLKARGEEKNGPFI